MSIKIVEVERIGVEEVETIIRVTESGGRGPAGENITNPSYIDFNILAESGDVVGRLRWNNTDLCLEFVTAGGVIIQISQEVTILATNKTGADIPDGTPVYISGAQGQRPTITVAENTDVLATSRTIGLTTQDIADNATGFATEIGLVRGLDTSAFNDGDPVFVATDGDMIATEPAYPAHNMRIGYVVYSHATQGIILVDTQKGFHLENLYEVAITDPGNGEVLVYSGGQWINTNLFAQVAGFLNYQAPKTSLTPADTTTATVNVATNYDYTITPTGASFTLALSNIPAIGIAWSVTIYAIDWDGVTVTLPSSSVTSGGSGLSFTSGGGNDRLVIRGNSGPSGEKEFYNLPGDMQ